MTDWIGTTPRQIDELQAFDAMRHFLEAYWERGGKESAELALLLTYLDRDEGVCGSPLDIAQWDDFRTAVESVLRNGS